MKLSSIDSVVLTIISAFTMVCLPANVEANRNLLRRVKRGPPFEAPENRPKANVQGDRVLTRPGNYIDNPFYRSYLKDIKVEKPGAYTVKESFQLFEEPGPDDIGIYVTTDETGADVIRIQTAKPVSEALSKYTAQFSFMENAHFKPTGQEQGVLHLDAMKRLKSFTEDDLYNLFSRSPGKSNRPQLQLSFHKVALADSVRHYAMMQEAHTIARRKPQARMEIMPGKPLLSGGNPDIEMQIINQLDPTQIPEDVVYDLQRLAELPIVIRTEAPWRPMPFFDREGTLASNLKTNRMNEWAEQIERYRTKLANMLSLPVPPGMSREEQLTDFANEMRQTTEKDYVDDIDSYANYERLFAGQSTGKTKRSVLGTVEQQEKGGPSGKNATAATEFEMYLSFFQDAQSNITELITPYIFDIMNLTANSSIITSLAASVFTDMTASVDQAIGPFMYGFDCLEWLESQYTNATSADDLSDDMLVMMAVHEFLAQVYGTVWANATSQMTTSGLLNESTTLARYITPEDLSMAPSMFTTVGGLQTAANGTEMESIRSNGTMLNWKRTTEQDDTQVGNKSQRYL